jgi:hypothetical protein
MRTSYLVSCLSVIALAFSHQAPAGIIFTGDPYFTLANEPGLTGPESEKTGTLVIERLPIGSGIPLSTPEALADGIEVGRGYVIRYIASEENVGESVNISWVADRDYISDGGLAVATIRADFLMELIDVGNLGLNFGYGAGVQANIFVSPQGAEVSGPDLADANIPMLSGNNPQLAVLRQSAANIALSPGNGTMRQFFTLNISPRAAGQELRMYISENTGITSTLAVGVVEVPEPPGIGLLALAGLLGVGALYRRKSHLVK